MVCKNQIVIIKNVYVHFNNVKGFTMKNLFMMLAFVTVFLGASSAFADTSTNTNTPQATSQPDAFDGVPTKEVSKAKLDASSGKGMMSNFWNNIYRGTTTGGTRGAAQRGQLGGCGGGFGKNGNC